MLAPNKWMLWLMCGTGMFLSAWATASGSAVSAVEEVFRKGVTHCHQASRLSRVQVEQARLELGVYLSLLERANSLSSDWISTNGFAKRETHRCALVKDNIDRIQALALAEEGMEQCLKVQNELKSGTVDGAKHHFEKYQQLSEAALAVTPTVLRVGSLGTRMRRCDQLVEKIALAEAWLNRLNTEVRSLEMAYQAAADHCTQGLNLLQGDPAESRLRASREVLSQVERELASLQPSSSALKNSRVSGLVQQVEDCQQSLLMDVAAMRLQLQEEAASSVSSAVVQLADPGL